MAGPHMMQMVWSRYCGVMANDAPRARSSCPTKRILVLIVRVRLWSHWKLSMWHNELLCCKFACPCPFFLYAARLAFNEAFFLPSIRAGKYDQLTYHGLTSRGSQPITFIPAGGAAVAVPDSPEQYLNVTFNNFNVPTNYTSYMCKASEGRMPACSVAVVYIV